MEKSINYSSSVLTSLFPWRVESAVFRFMFPLWGVVRQSVAITFSGLKGRFAVSPSLLECWKKCSIRRYSLRLPRLVTFFRVVYFKLSSIDWICLLLKDQSVTFSLWVISPCVWVEMTQVPQWVLLVKYWNNTVHYCTFQRQWGGNGLSNVFCP